MGAETAHTLVIQERQNAELTGILDVESYQETGILLVSSLGEIAIEGNELKIESFSVETGRIRINGHIGGLYYNDREKNRAGLFSRRSKG